MFNLNSGEVLLLGLLAILLLGPNRLPEYAARLAQLVRTLRDLAEGAKGQLRREMGPAFDDIDWQQLDPRQYDPRRIVREALSSPPEQGARGSSPARAQQARPGGTRARGSRGGHGAGGQHGSRRPEHAEPRRPADPPGRVPGRHDPTLPTPFDPDAT